MSGSSVAAFGTYNPQNAAHTLNWPRNTQQLAPAPVAKESACKFFEWLIVLEFRDVVDGCGSDVQ
jgi:hypothetical protein